MHYLILDRKYKVDFILLAGYLKLISSELVQAYPRSILNIHPSLLPAFGGKGYYGMKVHKAVIASGARYDLPSSTCSWLSFLILLSIFLISSNGILSTYLVQVLFIDYLLSFPLVLCGCSFRYSGPTIHYVDEEYDRGRILAQRVVPVLANDTAEDLASRVLHEVSCVLLLLQNKLISSLICSISYKIWYIFLYSGA